MWNSTIISSTFRLILILNNILSSLSRRLPNGIFEAFNLCCRVVQESTWRAHVASWHYLVYQLLALLGGPSGLSTRDQWPLYFSAATLWWAATLMAICTWQLFDGYLHLLQLASHTMWTAPTTHWCTFRRFHWSLGLLH